MSWFEEQLRFREQSDNADFADAIESIAGAVMGKRLTEALDSKEIAGSAIEEILKFRIIHSFLPLFCEETAPLYPDISRYFCRSRPIITLLNTD